MEYAKIAIAAAFAACAAQGGVKINVAGEDFPDKVQWAETELVPKLEDWFDNIVALLDGPGAVGDWGEVRLELSRKPDVAHTVTGENLVRLNMDWAAKDPDEVVGACIHELAHVVQDYRAAPGRAEPYNRCPLWLSEGIADWVRWCVFEGQAGVDDVNSRAKARPKHDDSYRITAAFLDWVVKKYGRETMVKLNQACRNGTYTDETWVELTGIMRLRLAAEWRRELVNPGVDAVNIVSSTSRDVLDWIDPFIGTGGTGHTSPAATVPFGMLQPGPDTGCAKWQYCGGYQYSDPRIVRFSQTHLSGTGCYEFSDVGFMPFTGCPKDAVRGFKYDKSTESATPGYYAVTLENDVKVEATATPHAAIYRITYPEGANARLLFDPAWSQRTNIVSVDVFPLKNGYVTGRVDRKGWPDHDYFFAWRLSSAPFAREPVETIGPDEAERIAYTLDSSAGNVVYLKVALSRSSADGAVRNIETEIPGWDFDGVRAAAAGKWRELVGRVEAKGTEEQLKIFYTAIYHVLFQPNLISDAGEEDLYSTFSCWDTYRSAGPLYTILTPEYVAPFVNSFIWHFDHNGFLPIWALWGIDNQCMIGTHSIPMLVDAYLKGFDGVDWEKAYYCVETSLVKNRNHRKANFDILGRYGYYPYDLVAKEGVSRLLECNYDDACAARMAAGLGKTADAEFFFARSHCWTNLFDSATGFLRPKDSKGNWREEFDPFSLANYNRDYCEGNAFHWNWHVMQDPYMLIDMLGGNEKACARLEDLFKQDPYRGNSGGDGNENGLVGQYCHGNEPCHHVIYFFTLMNRRDLTAKYVDEVASTLYTADFFGVTGNEDCGQMSSWYVYSAMGFFPFDPCGVNYVLGEPFLKEVKVKTAPGKVFTVKTGSGCVKLNGKPVSGPYVDHREIMAGATLEF